jgi:CRP-like cAMP-binding protein
MPELPDAGAIAQQVKARIKQIEDQLKQHDKLTDELERLRDALSRLEGAAGARMRTVRRTRTPEAQRAGGATRTRAASATVPKRATGAKPSRAPRGQNKAKVLDALKDGPMTASEIARATGIAPGTVSTLLTKLAKTGELAKAERGYRLPQ